MAFVILKFHTYFGINYHYIQAMYHFKAQISLFVLSFFHLFILGYHSKNEIKAKWRDFFCRSSKCRKIAVESAYNINKHFTRGLLMNEKFNIGSRFCTKDECLEDEERH